MTSCAFLLPVASFSVDLFARLWPFLLDQVMISARVCWVLLPVTLFLKLPKDVGGSWSFGFRSYTICHAKSSASQIEVVAAALAASPLSRMVDIYMPGQSFRLKRSVVRDC